jgi:TPR repeat protein
MYHFGHGVPQDYATALRWYRLAAAQGDADAAAAVKRLQQILNK